MTLFRRLCRPIELGGLGMAPSEAKQLTIFEAWMFLADDKELHCARTAKGSGRSAVMTPAEARAFREKLKRERESESS